MAFIQGKVNDFGKIIVMIIIKASFYSHTLYLVLREQLYTTFMSINTWDVMINNETDFVVCFVEASIGTYEDHVES